MNNFKPLCVISPNELLCLKRNKLYRYNSKMEESLYICDIPNSKLRNLFLFFDILTRRFGLNNAKAAKLIITLVCYGIIIGFILLIYLIIRFP